MVLMANQLVWVFPLAHNGRFFANSKVHFVYSFYYLGLLMKTILKSKSAAQHRWFCVSWHKI